MNVSPAIDRVMQGGTPARDLHQMNLRECQQFAKELRDVLANYELALAVAGNWKRRFEALEASATPTAGPEPDKGVKYREGVFYFNGQPYATIASVISNNTPKLNDADYPALLALKEQAETVAPAHNCGAQGFDPWKGDKCLGCEAERAASGTPAAEAKPVVTVEDKAYSILLRYMDASDIALALPELRAAFADVEQPREMPVHIKKALATLAHARDVLAIHAPHIDGAYNSARHDVAYFIAHLGAPKRLTVQEHVDSLVAMGAKRGCGLGALSVPLMSPQGVFAMTVEASRCLVLPEVAK